MEWIFGLLIFLIFALGAGGLAYWLARRKKTKTIDTAEPVVVAQATEALLPVTEALLPVTEALPVPELKVEETQTVKQTPPPAAAQPEQQTLRPMSQQVEVLLSTSKSSAEFAAMAKQFKTLMGEQLANAKHDRLILHALGFVLQHGGHQLIEGKQLRESITPIVIDEMAVLLFHVNRTALIGSYVDQPMEKASMNDLKIHYRTYMVQLMRKNERFQQIVQNQDHWQKKSG